MTNLKATFSQAFGIPIDPLLDTDQELYPFGNNPDESQLFGSRIALKKPMLLQGHIQLFQSSAPQGYFLVGFWGHGLNSYAFYYQVVDSWRRIFFRLPHGGVYMDNKKNALLIRQFIEQYFDMQNELKSRLNSWVAVETMGEGYYKAILTDGKIVELNESLFQCSNLREKFKGILKGEG